MNYIVAVDYFVRAENQKPYSFLKLKAKNLKDAMIEAPAVVIDKIAWRAKTMLEKIFCLRILKQTKEQAENYEATDCLKQFIVQDMKWIDNDNGINTWYNVEAK